jgi:hypothetical protein
MWRVEEPAEIKTSLPSEFSISAQEVELIDLRSVCKFDTFMFILSH